MACTECTFQSGPSADGVCASIGDLLLGVGVGEQNSAADGWKLVLHSEPCGSVCAVAFTAIEADLESFGHGQEAGHSMRGRAIIYISCH